MKPVGWHCCFHSAGSRLRGWFLLALCGGVCAPASAPGQSLTVAVVKSAIREEYEQTCRALLGALRDSAAAATIAEFVMESGAQGEAALWARVRGRRPDVIVTVGSPATLSALEAARGVPLVFTMVLDRAVIASNPSGPADDPGLSGITLAVPEEQQLTLLHRVLPSARRVGVLLGSEATTRSGARQRAAQRAGLRLVTGSIGNERDIPSALRNMLDEIDLLWMPPDAIVYDPGVLRFILVECYRNNVPVMAVSRQIAEAGSPLAVGFDYADIGRQTAALVLRVLTNPQAALGAIESPRKVVLYVNERVAAGLRLEIPRDVMEHAVRVDGGR